MFHLFQPKKKALSKMADDFSKQAKSDLVKTESQIIKIILENEHILNSKIFFEEPKELCLDVVNFAFQMLHNIKPVTSVFETLEKGSQEEQSRIIKIWKQEWLNQLDKLLNENNMGVNDKTVFESLEKLLLLHTNLEISQRPKWEN